MPLQKKKFFKGIFFVSFACRNNILGKILRYNGVWFIVNAMKKRKNVVLVVKVVFEKEHHHCFLEDNIGQLWTTH